jgi:copper(I)-binding protein
MKTHPVRRMVGVALAALIASASLAACAPAASGPQIVPTVSQPWVKAVPELMANMKMAGMTMDDMNMTALFGVFSNSSDKTIYILGGTADAALTDSKLDAHEVVKGADGKMMMQEVKGGIPIPAHGSVTLKPGSYHVMFWKLKKPITVGETVPVTINFSNGTSLKVDAVSRDIANYAG